MKAVLVWAAFFLLASPAWADRVLDGGEIGNAFVPFESIIGEYALEYPAGWQKNDLSQLTSFSDPKPSGESASFLSVLTDQFKGIATLEDLSRHLRFFRADADWKPFELAGLRGFAAELNGVRLVYLLRGPENVMAIRFRSSEGEVSDKMLSHMLGSLKVY